MGLKKLHDHGLVSKLYEAGDKSNLNVFANSKRALGSDYGNLLWYWEFSLNIWVEINDLWDKAGRSRCD